VRDGRWPCPSLPAAGPLHPGNAGELPAEFLVTPLLSLEVFTNAVSGLVAGRRFVDCGPGGHAAATAGAAVPQG